MSLVSRIRDFPNYYVTDTGDVYSRDYRSTGRIKKLKPYEVAHGYLAVCLYRGKRRCFKKVHRLVAEAFVPNPDNKPEVNHIDGDKRNTKASNLEWATRSENIKHSIYVLGHSHITNVNKGKFGKENHLSKIVQQIKNGITIGEFYCLREASEATGIPANNISICCRGITKSSGGFQWKYKQKAM